MLAILGFLGGLVDPISKIAGKIADAKIAATVASTDKERIAAEERAKALEARQTVMVAETNTPFNSFIRACYALPPAIYLGKLFVWDKVLKLGITDPLSPMMEAVLWTAVGFYFLDHTVARFKR